jgi:alanine dehydrogenase
LTEDLAAFPEQDANSASPPKLTEQSNAPVFVSAAAATEVLDLREIIERLTRAYSVPIQAASNPPRVLVRGEGVWMRCLAAAPPASKVMGTKIFGLGPDRTVNYLITLLDQRSAKIVALVDAWQITALRTAATSAMAVDRLAPSGPVSVAVLGSGLEAQTHLRALSQVRSISSVTIFSPTPSKRVAFARSAAAELSIGCRATDSPADAVADAQVVIAAARSYGEEPILRAQWLSEDVTVVSIGSTLPEQRELDVSVIETADLIVCDTVEEVVHETGDMLAAAAAGLNFSGKLASLNALMMGELTRRVANSRRRLFKSVGSALQDVVVAELAYERALARGLTLLLPIPFHTKHV